MRQRSERLFAALEADVDVIVIANGVMPMLDSTFFYVSGVVSGGFEGCAAVLRKGEQPQLVVSALEEQSARGAPDCEVLAWETQEKRKEIMKLALGDAERIGINAAAIVKAKADELLQFAPAAVLVDVGSAVTKTRLVKDEDEIARVRAACTLTSDVAAAIPDLLRGGMTEAELAAEIDFAMAKGGGTTAFDTIVCFGENGAEPHYTPGDVPLKKGDMILIDFGARLNRYCADITRMYVFGTATPEQRAMFDVVRDAQRYALSLVKAGAGGRDVHLKVREHIDATAYKDRFIHGTGHSVGLDVHDGPGIGESSEISLPAGMIVTVEPGVYVPGVGGVRIEDTVVVTDGEPDILTPVTKDLVEVAV
jgi:Xaa-Pro dipeptidase